MLDQAGTAAGALSLNSAIVGALSSASGFFAHLWPLASVGSAMHLPASVQSAFMAATVSVTLFSRDSAPGQGHLPHLTSGQQFLQRAPAGIAVESTAGLAAGAAGGSAARLMA